MFFHGCFASTLRGSKKKKKINGKVENYGEKEERKYTWTRIFIVLSSKQKAGITFSILNWIVEKPLLLASMRSMCFTMQKTIFDYVNRYSVALRRKARHIVMQDVNAIYIGLKRRYKFHGDP